jgi:hypothetical protein
VSGKVSCCVDSQSLRERAEVESNVYYFLPRSVARQPCVILKGLYDSRFVGRNNQGGLTFCEVAITLTGYSCQDLSVVVI